MAARAGGAAQRRRGPPASLVLATRADGTGGGSASQLWCGAKWTERSPAGTDDRQCSWDAVGASRGGVRAAGSSHGRLRSCPGGLSLVAGGQRPHRDVPPPEDISPEEEEGRGGEAAGGEARGEDKAAQRQGPPRPAAHSARVGGMAAVDGPRPLLVLFWAGEEEEDSPNPFLGTGWCAEAMWARIPLSLCVVWCSCVYCVLHSLVCGYGDGGTVLLSPYLVLVLVCIASLGVRAIVFLCLLRYISYGWRQAQDARHHGRYGPEGQLRSEFVAALVADYGGWHVFCWFCWWMQFALCSLRCRQVRRQVRYPFVADRPCTSASCQPGPEGQVWDSFAGCVTGAMLLLVVDRPRMPSIMVGLNQEDSYDGWVLLVTTLLTLCLVDCRQAAVPGIWSIWTRRTVMQ